MPATQSDSDYIPLDDLQKKIWLTSKEVHRLFGIHPEQSSRIPVAEVPRFASGKSHLFLREALLPFTLKVAASGASLRAYCEQGGAAPRARKRGRPRKDQSAPCDAR